MALIKCPECGKEISEKAASCPHCGCPASEFQKVPEKSYEFQKVENENPKNENQNKSAMKAKMCYRCGKYIYQGSEICPYCNIKPLWSDEWTSQAQKKERDHTGELITLRFVCNIIMLVVGAFILYQSLNLLAFDYNGASTGLWQSFAFIICGIVGLATKNYEKHHVCTSLCLALVFFGAMSQRANVVFFKDLRLWGYMSVIIGGIYGRSSYMIRQNCKK